MTRWELAPFQGRSTWSSSSRQKHTWWDSRRGRARAGTAPSPRDSHSPWAWRETRRGQGGLGQKVSHTPRAAAWLVSTKSLGCKTHSAHTQRSPSPREPCVLSLPEHTLSWPCWKRPLLGSWMPLPLEGTKSPTEQSSPGNPSWCPAMGKQLVHPPMFFHIIKSLLICPESCNQSSA
jgi:hypothetical protein